MFWRCSIVHAFVGVLGWYVTERCRWSIVELIFAAATAVGMTMHCGRVAARLSRENTLVGGCVLHEMIAAELGDGHYDLTDINTLM